MGSANKYNEKSKNPLKSKNLRSKGDRLGWLSLKETKSVDITKVLVNGEVIKINKDNQPILVP
jgi:hypothetical protein